MRFHLLLISSFFLIFGALNCAADSGSDSLDLEGLRERAVNGQQQANPRPPEAPTASQKTFDKRLPPVLPGETVTDSSGKKMRVWSTSGPVVVSEAPEPWKKEGELNQVAPGGVIVDRRGE